MSSAGRRALFALTIIILIASAASFLGPRIRLPVRQWHARVNTSWFEEVAAQNGLRFTYRSGGSDRHFLPEIMGGGVALFDMDGDGNLDVFLVQGGSLVDTNAGRCGSQLFRNRGDGTFTNVTAGSGAEVNGYGMGVTAADYNNDGKIDLYVTRVGSNVLLRNDGHGHFTDVTKAAGVTDAGWSTGAAFVDVDGDGALDLFVVHYINWSPDSELECYTVAGASDYCSPKNYHAPSVATLFRNNGDGTFTDVSVQSGVHDAAGNGLGITVGDFDGDGKPDIFVANDGSPNHLWLNQGHGRFRNEALTMGCALDQDGVPKAGMGTHAIDADDDGRLDLLVVNLSGETDSFLHNRGAFFEDDSATVALRQISRAFTRFGTALIDFDNDGLLDLFEACGAVSIRADAIGNDPYAEPNLLFHRAVGGGFEEVRPRGGTDPILIATSRGAAFGDIDNDGKIDIVVVNRDAPAYLLHNIVSTSGHWLGFRVLDENGRDAFGAEVTLTVVGKRIRRDVQVAYSYLASNDPRVHFGLGSSTSADDVRVRWPDGMTETFCTILGDRYAVIQRGHGRRLIDERR